LVYSLLVGEGGRVGRREEGGERREERGERREERGERREGNHYEGRKDGGGGERVTQRIY
jgi:hypothetical protein